MNDGPDDRLEPNEEAVHKFLRDKKNFRNFLFFEMQENTEGAK